MSSIFPAYSPVGEIRPAAILTNAYVIAATFGDQNWSSSDGANPSEAQVNNESTELVLDFTYTKGSLTSCSIKIEFSTDGTTWFQEQSETTSAGVSTVSDRTHLLTGAATARKGSITISMTHPMVRVSAIGTGTVTGSSLALSAHFIRKI